MFFEKKTKQNSRKYGQSKKYKSLDKQVAPRLAQMWRHRSGSDRHREFVDILQFPKGNK